MLSCRETTHQFHTMRSNWICNHSSKTQVSTYNLLWLVQHLLHYEIKGCFVLFLFDFDWNWQTKCGQRQAGSSSTVFLIVQLNLPTAWWSPSNQLLPCLGFCSARRCWLITPHLNFMNQLFLMNDTVIPTPVTGIKWNRTFDKYSTKKLGHSNAFELILFVLQAI